MVHYVMLLNYNVDGFRAVQNDPRALRAVEDTLARWEAKVVSNFYLIGEHDQCLIVDAPDNLKPYQAALANELSATADTRICRRSICRCSRNCWSATFTSKVRTRGRSVGGQKRCA